MHPASCNLITTIRPTGLLRPNRDAVAAGAAFEVRTPVAGGRRVVEIASERAALALVVARPAEARAAAARDVAQVDEDRHDPIDARDRRARNAAPLPSPTMYTSGGRE